MVSYSPNYGTPNVSLSGLEPHGKCLDVTLENTSSTVWELPYTRFCCFLHLSNKIF